MSNIHTIETKIRAALNKVGVKNQVQALINRVTKEPLLSISFESGNDSKEKKDFMKSLFIHLFSKNNIGDILCTPLSLPYPGSDKPRSFNDIFTLTIKPEWSNFLENLPEDFFESLYKKNKCGTNLQDCKNSIISILEKKYSWKPRLFGHHHHNRCVAVSKAIKKAQSFSEIKLILLNQSNMENTKEKQFLPINNDILSWRWSELLLNSEKTTTQNSGYQKAIAAALENFEAITASNSPQGPVANLTVYR